MLDYQNTVKMGDETKESEQTRKSGKDIYEQNLLKMLDYTTQHSTQSKLTWILHGSVLVLDPLIVGLSLIAHSKSGGCGEALLERPGLDMSVLHELHAGMSPLHDHVRDKFCPL